MRFTAVAAIVVAVLGVAGCGGGTGAGNAGQGASTPATGAAGTTSVAAGTTTVSADQEAFIKALNAIDADIVGDKAPSTIVSRGRNQCDTITKFPDDKTKQLADTKTRFTSPKHPNGFPPATVEKILDAVKTHLCP